MTKIFCSTGGAKKSALDVAEYFLSNSITNIELSGGIYDPKTFDRILDLQSKGANFLTHNYFPVPKESFVLNLASQNKKCLLIIIIEATTLKTSTLSNKSPWKL